MCCSSLPAAVSSNYVFKPTTENMLDSSACRAQRRLNTALDILMIRLRDLFFIALVFSSPIAAEDLSVEIESWKPGDEVPHRLLSFPDGHVDANDPNMCGLAAYMESVRPYVEGIENDALLEELVFDRRSANTTFHSAATQLIQRKGLEWFAERLEAREATRWEHEAFAQMLRSRFAKISVAFIDAMAMPEEEATKALKLLRTRLDAGQPWGEAYRVIADEFPDVERRRREPRVPTTLVTYLFDGWISAHGFDFSQLGNTSNLPLEHLGQVVNAGPGGRLIKTAKGVYLYFVTQVYAPDV